MRGVRARVLAGIARLTGGVAGAVRIGCVRCDGGREGGAYTLVVARFLDVHPDNPQPRLLQQIVTVLRDDGLIAYPTDSCYALGCTWAAGLGSNRIRDIRKLDDRHHFTLMCRDFAGFGQFVQISNSVFRLVKAVTPGSYTLLLAGEP